MPYQKPLVILRSNDNCFLDIIRACGRCGIETISVIFSWDGATWKSEKSSYLKNIVRITNPAENEQLAVQELCALGQRLLEKYGERLLVISSSDTNLYFMQKNFETFSPYFLQMGHSSFDKSCMRELRKDSAAELLKQGNVEIPLSYPVLSASDVTPTVDNMRYPCVYKPILKDLTGSFQKTHAGKKAVECTSKTELREKLLQELKNGYKLIVQEKIMFQSLEDEVSCYMYVNGKGNIQAISGQHKILEHPHPYGTGVVSVPFMDEEFIRIAHNIAKAYKWRGFLGIEFMRNKKNGKWTVIEINLRPWISVNFQASLGFNYLKMLYDDFYGETTDEIRVMDSSFCAVYRINLTMLVQKVMADCDNAHITMERIKTGIKNNLGQMIFSYYIYNDEGPGLAEKEDLIQKYPQQQQIIEEIYDLIQENNRIIAHKTNGFD